MNIVYASNDDYAVHLAVSMTSLFDNNRDAGDITVYVISVGISEENKAKLRGIAKLFGRDIHIIEMDSVRERFDFDIDTRGFDESALVRFFVGELLPDDISKVLYLDCDTVVARPLDLLWNSTLKDCMIKAVPEPTIYQNVKDEIGLGEDDIYYNSGVLLIDLEKWRSSAALNRLLEFYKEKGGNLFACDQDTINGALKGEIAPVSPVYNFFPNYRYFTYETLTEHCPSYKVISKKEFLEAKENPAIIHFTGDERPWVAGNRNHYRGEYEKYLAMTPWAARPKEKGKRLYMGMYHLMDYVTAICPEARWKISERFGMKAIDARAGKNDETGNDSKICKADKAEENKDEQ